MSDVSIILSAFVIAAFRSVYMYCKLPVIQNIRKRLVSFSAINKIQEAETQSITRKLSIGVFFLSTKFLFSLSP